MDKPHSVRIRIGLFPSGSVAFAADPTINFANLKILQQIRFLDPLFSSGQGSTMPGFDNFFHQDLTPFRAVPTPFAADPTFPDPAINYANLKILLQFRFLDPLISSSPRLNNAWIQLFFFRIRALFLRIRHSRIHQSFCGSENPSTI